MSMFMMTVDALSLAFAIAACACDSIVHTAALVVVVVAARSVGSDWIIA